MTPRCLTEPARKYDRPHPAGQSGAGCRLLVAGCWLLVAGCRTIDWDRDRADPSPTVRLLQGASAAWRSVDVEPPAGHHALRPGHARARLADPSHRRQLLARAGLQNR